MNSDEATGTVDRTPMLRRLGFGVLFFCAFVFTIAFYGGLAWGLVRVIKTVAALVAA